MQSTESRQIRTGGDPRSFPDFSALRDEISKQTHPARPDINWDTVEQLSLSLFEKNGIELQTGAWFTLARSHLAQCAGMNEGLSIICAMLSHQWSQFWPQGAHARAEILSGLFRRLQNVFRTFSPGNVDRSSLHHLGTTLNTLNDILIRHELHHVCQLAPLLKQVHSAITRLENAPFPEQVPAVIPPCALVSTADTFAEQSGKNSPPLVYVIRQDPAVQVEVTQDASRSSTWGKTFACGMVTAFVVSVVAFTGWYYLSRPSAEMQALRAVLQPLPHPLTPAEISSLHIDKKSDKLAALWVSQTSARLNALAALPPDWSIHYGQGLVSQTNALWPGRPDAKQLEVQWQQQLALNGISADSLNGWHEGMGKLQALTTQLNALDGQKGKYITVSELKSQVFAATQAFNKTVPVEEQLRQMSAHEKPQRIPAALKMQTEWHLKQLITRYSTVTESK